MHSNRENNFQNFLSDLLTKIVLTVDGVMNLSGNQKGGINVLADVATFAPNVASPSVIHLYVVNPSAIRLKDIRPNVAMHKCHVTSSNIVKMFRCCISKYHWSKMQSVSNDIPFNAKTMTPLMILKMYYKRMPYGEMYSVQRSGVQMSSVKIFGILKDQLLTSYPQMGYELLICVYRRNRSDNCIIARCLKWSKRF